MATSLRVAVAQPRCRPLDVEANVAAHAEAVRAAGARLVVFPELSLTGYELDAEAIDPADARLRPLVAACAEARAVALVGAPVVQGDRRRIATLLVDGERAVVVYAKSHLGGDEPRGHQPGPGPAAVDLDGWRVGLGTCKDTGVTAHVEGTAALGVDLYVAGLVHAPDELDEQDARGRRIAAACGAPVAFASAAGPAGGPYGVTAGTSTVWSASGEVLARATASAGEVVGATLRPRT